MMFCVKGNRGIALLGLLVCGLPAAFAKTTSGQFQFYNKKTDHVISSYSIAAGASGLMTAVLLSKEKYENEDNLKLRLYLDEDWPKVQRAKTCQEKIKYARQTEDIKFELEDIDKIRRWGYKFPKWRSETHLKIEPLESENDYAPRHHYWYIAIDDCSLEGSRKTLTMPRVQYSIQIYNMLSENALTHLSTDEFLISRVHTFTMFLSAFVCCLLFGRISYHLTTSGIVHVAMFMVMGAAGFDTASSAFELMHMNFYRFDGVGWYTLDAISAYNEAICDAIVCFLLVAIAAGWTLPSDAISVQRCQDNATLIQKILVGLANPTGSGSWVNPFSGLLVGLVSTHLVMAHWGLNYNDDFDSYHDLEHLPGKILMMLRSSLGFFMLAAIVQTRMKCKASLHSFYLAFAIVGTIWFQGLPVITWFCNNVVAFHQRHPTVIVSGAVLQSTSLLVLSWLVAVNGSTSYHKVSHMTQSGDNNLTEKMASVGTGSDARMWSFFGNRAKVRLD